MGVLEDEQRATQFRAEISCEKLLQGTTINDRVYALKRWNPVGEDAKLQKKDILSLIDSAAVISGTKVLELKPSERIPHLKKFKMNTEWANASTFTSSLITITAREKADSAEDALAIVNPLQEPDVKHFDVLGPRLMDLVMAPDMRTKLSRQFFLNELFLPAVSAGATKQPTILKYCEAWAEAYILAKAEVEDDDLVQGSIYAVQRNCLKDELCALEAVKVLTNPLCRSTHNTRLSVRQMIAGEFQTAWNSVSTALDGSDHYSPLKVEFRKKQMSELTELPKIDAEIAALQTATTVEAVKQAVGKLDTFQLATRCGATRELELKIFDVLTRMVVSATNNKDTPGAVTVEQMQDLENVILTACPKLMGSGVGPPTEALDNLKTLAQALRESTNNAKQEFEVVKALQSMIDTPSDEILKIVRDASSRMEEKTVVNVPGNIDIVIRGIQALIVYAISPERIAGPDGKPDKTKLAQAIDGMRLSRELVAILPSTHDQFQTLTPLVQDYISFLQVSLAKAEILEFGDDVDSQVVGDDSHAKWDALRSHVEEVNKVIEPRRTPPPEHEPVPPATLEWFAAELKQGADIVRDYALTKVGNDVAEFKGFLLALAKVAGGTEDASLWSASLDDSSSWEDVKKAANKSLFKIKGLAGKLTNLKKEVNAAFVIVKSSADVYGEWTCRVDELKQEKDAGIMRADTTLTEAALVQTMKNTVDMESRKTAIQTHLDKASDLKIPYSLIAPAVYAEVQRKLAEEA